VARYFLSEGVNKGRITLQRCVEFCCENPAKAFGLFSKNAALRIGAGADSVRVDLKKKQTINKNMLLTSAGWSIFEGWKVTVAVSGYPERRGCFRVEREGTEAPGWSANRGEGTRPGNWATRRTRYNLGRKQMASVAHAMAEAPDALAK
jgi:hypothetical protein